MPKHVEILGHAPALYIYDEVKERDGDLLFLQLQSRHPLSHCSPSPLYKPRLSVHPSEELGVKTDYYGRHIGHFRIFHAVASITKKYPILYLF